MSTQKDYYEILGIERGAEAREIKRAYRALARELHPDLPENEDNEEAAERFREVREAYEVLSDPTRKREYDIWGQDPFGASDLPWAETQHARYTSREESAEDIELATDTGQQMDGIFGDLFAQDPSAQPAPGGKESPWRPAEMERQARLEIAAEVKANKARNAEAERRAAAARGRSDKGQEVGDGSSKGKWGFDVEGMAQAAFWGELDDLEPAPEAGPMPDHDPWAPDQAEGGPKTRRKKRTTGKDKARPTGNGRVGQARRAAGRKGRKMDASGRRPPPEPPEEVDRPPEGAPRVEDLRITVQVPFLLALNGGTHNTRFRLPDASGRWTMEELALTVPPGLEDGGRLRLPGKGNFSEREGQRGDLLVDVVVEDHPYFRREGVDVVIDLPVTPAEAAAGCRVEVPTLDGRAWVRVPPGAPSGRRILLRGFGLLDPRSGRRGNQFVVVHIQLPPRMGREEIGLLMQLDERTGWDPRARWWEEL